MRKKSKIYNKTEWIMMVIFIVCFSFLTGEIRYNTIRYSKRKSIQECSRVVTDRMTFVSIKKKAKEPASDSKSRIAVSQKEYDILTRIVEAEATDKDEKSKILVANVILNRVKNQEFPDNIEDVVFEEVNGAVQFSPVADGRYYSVDVKKSTLESVDRALAGEDYSKGALYFMERSMADADNASWFDRCLTRLFEYQGHEFYK